MPIPPDKVLGRDFTNSSTPLSTWTTSFWDAVAGHHWDVALSDIATLIQSLLTPASSFWTLPATAPTRVSNTTFTFPADYTNIFRKGLVIKWAEGGTTRWGMVSI